MRTVSSGSTEKVLVRPSSVTWPVAIGSIESSTGPRTRRGARRFAPGEPFGVDLLRLEAKTGMGVGDRLDQAVGAAEEDMIGSNREQAPLDAGEERLDTRTAVEQSRVPAAHE